MNQPNNNTLASTLSFFAKLIYYTVVVCVWGIGLSLMAVGAWVSLQWAVGYIGLGFTIVISLLIIIIHQLAKK